jgi:hypothetical protein
LWKVKQYGPFLVGGSNASWPNGSGGAAVRDTRLPSKPDGSGKPECDTVFAKRSEAIAWVEAYHANAQREGTDEQRADARARIDSDGNAR